MLLDLMITRALEAVSIPSNSYLSPIDFLWMQFRCQPLVSSQSVDVHISNHILQSSNDTRVCVQLM